MDQELLLYNLRPTAAQVRTTFLAALFLLAAFLVALPFRQVPLARVDAFVPLYDNTVLLGDWITATLLFAQAAVLRSKALVALATGYFFTGLIIIPHALAFPFAFTPAGLLSGGLNNTVWLYLFWHLGLPVSVIAFALLKNAPDWPNTASLSPRVTIAACVTGAAAVAGALTMLATVGGALLPSLMPDPVGWHPYQAFYGTGPLMLLIAGATALIWRRRSSALDLWLTLVLWGWFLELLLSTLTTYRFGAAWYSARMIGLVSNLFVLLMLLVQTSQLYGRTVLQMRARRWEQENRFMIRGAIAASIAHELRQPLTAIRLDAETGQRLVPPSEAMLSSIMDEIVSESYRATDIIENIRALFGKSTAQKKPANINQLVRDTLVVVSRDLQRRGVTVNLQLDDSLPAIAVNRIQMQQVLFNLFTNAAEAMSSVAQGARTLTIRSAARDGLVISVEDTGPGIPAADQERIFEIFYTTKDHGTGLGLSICRSVVEAHGGRLRAAARTPTGASFEICLPCGGSTETAVQTVSGGVPEPVGNL